MSAPAEPGRIGPNAITRMAEALELLAGAQARDAIFEEAGLTHHLATPPTRMVPDDEVALLHAAVFAHLGVARGRAIGVEAGRRTGAYLLGHRIPKLARWLLPLLPRRLALNILLKAIERHAWTFAGRGVFTWKATSEGFELSLENNPVSRKIWAEEAVCDYYGATFETLFRALAGPNIRVEETECAAAGDPRCVFRVTL
jgi:divinyl protochlorophyllide a 8-vinyl-reductase